MSHRERSSCINKKGLGEADGNEQKGAKEMTITDPKAIKIIKRINDSILTETIESYPDNERDGRSDMEFLADEISYQISLYHEDGHDWEEDLREARRKLRETENGKITPVDPITFKPKYGYTQTDIQWCKDMVNGYNRLARALKKLQSEGLYGFWYQV